MEIMHFRIFKIAVNSPKRYCASKGHGPSGPLAFSISGVCGEYMHFKTWFRCRILFPKMDYIHDLQVITLDLFGPCVYLVCSPRAAWPWTFWQLVRDLVRLLCYPGPGRPQEEDNIRHRALARGGCLISFFFSNIDSTINSNFLLLVKY